MGEQADYLIDTLVGEYYSIVRRMYYACKYCGQKRLKWRHTPELGWRLYKGNDVHECTQYRRTKR